MSPASCSRAAPRREGSCWSASTAAISRPSRSCRSGSRSWRRRLPPDVPAVAESGVATPADAHRGARGWAIGWRLIGTALMAREDPAASSPKSCRGTDSAAPKWLHSPPCGSRSAASPAADAVSAAAGGPSRCHRLRVRAEPAAGDAGAGGAARGARAAGHSAHRGRAAPAADEGRRDLPDAEARLLSNRRRGSARAARSRRTSRCCRSCASAARPRARCRAAWCSRVRRAASASWRTGDGRRSSPARPR